MRDIPKDTLIKASRGDMDSFEAIYKETSGFVYTIALRITRNPQDAQEVTQDVFIKIHRNLRSFRFRAAFKTWVYRIVANTAINYYRVKRKERSRRADFDEALKIHGKESEIEGVIMQNDAKDKVDILLGILNPDQRACIVLREIEGLSYEEISRILKININTVRSRLKRARESLLAFEQKRVVHDEV